MFKHMLLTLHEIDFTLFVKGSFKRSARTFLSESTDFCLAMQLRSSNHSRTTSVCRHSKPGIKRSLKTFTLQTLAIVASEQYTGNLWWAIYLLDGNFQSFLPNRFLRKRSNFLRGNLPQTSSVQCCLAALIFHLIDLISWPETGAKKKQGEREKQMSRQLTQSWRPWRPRLWWGWWRAGTWGAATEGGEQFVREREKNRVENVFIQITGVKMGGIEFWGRGRNAAAALNPYWPWPV